ncbi:hypothetical protein E0H77_12600 [Acinetobacter sp. ANC 4633]|uniref:hypothetical protein n=1 Tax=Acinetobacter sp. ANC 4633 TaxID=2529845 RepID=UPI00103DA3D0|nr:hypothetical protein [Acinetobacter sp. ANC 4633]TCB23949.1 hypothetical protein E0H77_12600 [Acinetobacter sp. ANC 4633]
METTIDLTNTERRVSTAEFAMRMNFTEKELYERIKDGRKNFWLNSYVLKCVTDSNNEDLVA